jgi:hypothetical protein
MNLANPLWGAPRVHGELLKLEIDVGQTTSPNTRRGGGDLHHRAGRPSCAIMRTGIVPEIDPVIGTRLGTLSGYNMMSGWTEEGAEVGWRFGRDMMAFSRNAGSRPCSMRLPVSLRGIFLLSLGAPQAHNLLPHWQVDDNGRVHRSTRTTGIGSAMARRDAGAIQLRHISSNAGPPAYA